MSVYEPKIPKVSETYLCAAIYLSGQTREYTIKLHKYLLKLINEALRDTLQFRQQGKIFQLNYHY